MVSRKSIQFLPKIVRLSFLFGACPYKWNAKKGKIRVTRNIYSLTRWQLSIFATLVYPMYLVYSCFYSWRMSRPIVEFNMCFYMLIVTMILSTMHMMLARKTKEMAALINSALRYQNFFLRNYSTYFLKNFFNFS